MKEQGIPQKEIDWEVKRGAVYTDKRKDILIALNLNKPEGKYVIEVGELKDPKTNKPILGMSGTPIQFAFITDLDTGKIVRAGWELSYRGVDYGYEFFDSFDDLNTAYKLYFAILGQILPINGLVLSAALPFPEVTPIKSTPPLRELTPGEKAIAKVRAAGIDDCEKAASEVGKLLPGPGGRSVDLSVRAGNHTAYFKNDTWYDTCGFSYVLKQGYWTEAKLAEAGLLDAAKSGVFTPQQYEAFIKPFSIMPKFK